MKRWELLPNGVRKHFDWGYSEVYASFEECFTSDELIQVVSDLQSLKAAGALTPELNALLDGCKRKVSTWTEVKG